MERFYRKWLNYKIDTRCHMSFDDFMLPKVFADIHSKCVGTVLEKYDKRYKDKEHFMHFGRMVFYEYILVKEMQNEI